MIKLLSILLVGIVSIVIIVFESDIFVRRVIRYVGKNKKETN